MENLSKEAKEFLINNPELIEAVTQFEKIWEIDESLKDSKNILELLTENIFLNETIEDDTLRDSTVYIDVDNGSFEKPEISEIKYYLTEKGFGIEAYISYKGYGIEAFSDEVVYPGSYYEPPSYWDGEVNVEATVYVTCEIPKDEVENEAAFKVDIDDNIDYEII